MRTMFLMVAGLSLATCGCVVPAQPQPPQQVNQSVTVPGRPSDPQAPHDRRNISVTVQTSRGPAVYPVPVYPVPVYPCPGPVCRPTPSCPGPDCPRPHHAEQ